MNMAGSVRFVCSMVLVATLVSAAAAQKTERAATFAPARLQDGKTPDFRGIWQASGTAYVNIEGHAGEKGVRASASIVVDPRRRQDSLQTGGARAAR